MALPEISFKEYAKKSEKCSEFIAGRVNTLSVNGKKGWRGILEIYEWRTTKDWREGIKKRFEFKDMMQENISVQISTKKIMEWGGMRKFQQKQESDIRKAITYLSDEPLLMLSDTKIRRIGRIASLSKIFAMHNPEEWTIYDSRVANGLWKVISLDKRFSSDDSLRFPIPSSRKIKNLPSAPGPSSARQHLLAFINASWLMRGITKVMNGNPNKYGKPIHHQTGRTVNWAVYHVEMVLFMIGGWPTHL